MKKICIVTGTRAEYGLLYWLMKGIQNDPVMELQLLVTGMHLSPQFGSTWEQIEKDGFQISKKIEMDLSSDSSVGISKSMGNAQGAFAEAYEELKPELLVILGDRTEIFSAATAALISGIPIAHIHGGEVTEGAYDDAIRHSITKMSHLHFASTETYRQRIIQLGEQPANVYNVGALGLENIRRIELLTKQEFEFSINAKLKKINLLITYHPVTLENNSAKEQITNLIDALDELDDTLLIFTLPNSDKDGQVIIQAINDYATLNPEKVLVFKSLGQLRYLSALQYVDAVIGNSSSGIIEVPFFNIPTVNIGDRQKGRLMGDSVLNCYPDKESICEAVRNMYKIEFDNSKHPYGEGNSSELMLRVIKSIDSISLKKNFFDIKPS